MLELIERILLAHWHDLLTLLFNSRIQRYCQLGLYPAFCQFLDARYDATGGDSSPAGRETESLLVLQNLQSIQDIIQSGFEISTTTLPKDRLHKAGGLYEKKVNDGFEVLEIPKGSWTEAIFAKEKPKQEKIRMRFMDEDELDRNDDLLDPDEDDDEDAPEIEDHYNDPDEDDDAFDDDKLTEESYRTTFEDPENLGLDDAEDVADDEEY